MARLTTNELKDWGTSRDPVAELAQSVAGMKTGKASRAHHVEAADIVRARRRTGLSRRQLANVLGVSVRTLEGWEQGRRKPTGATRSLLTIALRRPDILRGLLGASD